MQTIEELQKQLNKIDQKGYPAYKTLQGQYSFLNYILSIDHVQGDPFASPSKLSIRIKEETAKFPSYLFDKSYKRIALQDYLTRLFFNQLKKYSFQVKGSGKSGLLTTSECGQKVLERTACSIQNGEILLRLEVGFPANGRTIQAKKLEKILFEFLPKIIANVLFYQNLDTKEIEQVIKLAQDQDFIRKKLDSLGLIAFVADGSILPRESGVSDKPLKDAVLFESPKSLCITLQLPNKGKLTGMGIKKGVTLIAGGGYHGKSTLLKALEAGVYNHIIGDGREYVITNDCAVKIRAEEGRSMEQVDISLFINHLPNKKDTISFSTKNASGSTSQAANIIEAIEAGSNVFLIDEDTTATNFMFRDELMQKVITSDKEPITPFSMLIKPFFKECGISTILVAGSLGTYFYLADTILQMDSYKAKDITQKAKDICKEYLPSSFYSETEQLQTKLRNLTFSRKLNLYSVFEKKAQIKIKSMGKDTVLVGKETIDLRYVEQIADTEQVRALGYLVSYMAKYLLNGKKDLQTAVAEVTDLIETKGIEFILKRLGKSPSIPFLAIPRKQEIFACLNRFRIS